MKQFPTILAIDTSCDDTSVAITQGMKVLSNIVASQTEIHRIYGGVYPLAAKLAHHELINPTYKEALKRALINPRQIDIIAVTQGPGLAIALEVGIEFAKLLSKELNKPLIAVNHMAGHLYSSLAVNSKGNPKPNVNHLIPSISLLVSGGHTELILIKSLNSFQKIGQTLDDAAGEALDKFARLLDLGYPGAAAMEEIAQKGNSKTFNFPLPMTQSKDFNYSFSGLKTAGRQTIEQMKKLNANDITNLAASFQYAVIKAVLYKLEKAIAKYQPKSIWLGGGVSANKVLKRELGRLCKSKSLNFLYPKIKRLNGDNAAMIGIAAYFDYQKGNLSSIPQNFDQIQRIPRLSL